MIVLIYVITALTTLALGALMQDKFRRTSIMMYFIGGIMLLPIWFSVSPWLDNLNDT